MTYNHINAHAHIHTYTHAHTHIYIQIHVHTLTHTQTHTQHVRTNSMPFNSSTAPSTSEKTPVPIIHSFVKPPLRTEGARSAVIKMETITIISMYIYSICLCYEIRNTHYYYAVYFLHLLLLLTNDCTNRNKL